MTEVDAFLGTVPVGTIYRHASSSGERISFRYAETWLAHDERFAIDPELFLDVRTTSPARGALFGAFTDCAPDRWGRQLMQRRERRAAKAERRPVRTLAELDYLLGVSDVSRAGALRFAQGGAYLAESAEVPPLVKLGDLLGAADRVARDEESAQDMALLLDPGSSLGGARPKASVLDAKSRLSIAKFPREDDEYNIERWEWVALKLAAAAGIAVPAVELLTVGTRQVLLSRRFDRHGSERVHYASALTMLNMRDGDRASYPEIADFLQREGSRPQQDCAELFRRMVLNICIANVDDHLRNHGFLREASGWTLSPAFDLNPVPADIRPRVLTTNVTPDDATGSLDAALEAATFFGLTVQQADAHVDEVLRAVQRWPAVARSAGASAKEQARMKSAFLTARN